MAERLDEVAPGMRVDPRHAFFAAETAEELLGGNPDAVIDAIDSLGPKVELLHQCQKRGLFVTSSLGAGGRLDPTQIRLAPLAATRADPLGVQVRKQLRRRGSLDGIDAAFSLEPPRPAASGDWESVTTDLHRGRQRVIQPSAVMVPAAMGMAIAAHVVTRLAGPRAG
jgi:tRNA A37 threonylcarbamoyladenosine dehydratase